MSNFFKNTRKLSIVLSALLLAITMTAGSFAYYTNGLPDTSPKIEEDGFSEMEALPDGLGEDGAAANLRQLSAKPMSVEPVSLNMPSQLSGVFLVPGSDFLKQKDSGADAVYKEIDKAVADVVALGLDSVVIDTVYNDLVIYKTSDSKTILPDADIMEYLLEKCRAANLYTSAIFDASHYMGDGDMDKLSKNAYGFVEKYSPASVFIDGYTNENLTVDYDSYIKQGGSIGIENYARESSASIVRTVANAVHKAAPGTAAGLLAGAVKTVAFDAKTFVERRFVDFVAVKAYSLSTDANEPFEEVVSQWNDIAENAGAPMYVAHASDKLGTPGWTADQLAQQAASISHYGAYRGSIYNNLGKIPTGSVEKAAPAKETSPAGDIVEPTVSTQKPVVTPVSTNGGQDAESDMELIKEISPTGVLMASIGDSLEITALAYRGASVMATVNGEIVFLELDESSDEGDSEYGLFTGTYEVPEPDDYYGDSDYDPDDDVQILGGLSVYASYGDLEDSVDGAYMKTETSRVPVQITADQARTYPAKTKNNVPIPTMYPLPKGATDYAVGKAFSYTSEKKVKYTFILLESGVRVETKDIKEISKGPGNNKVTGMTVTADKTYTYVALKTNQQVTYSFAYKGDSAIITLNNTKSSPSSKNLSSNPLFTKAAWSDGNTLTLTFAKKNGFMGYKGYYDSKGNLVFRFKNPPSSIKNAKIAIDPGHGGKDIGASGTNKDYPEKVLTRLIADKVVAELEARGAEVYLMETADVELIDRVKMAEKWGADILLSIHCNASTKATASGTEVYYFYPFSKQLAVNSSANVSKDFASVNRGAKLSYYHMTLSPQMTSVLVECGFVTNKAEYKKLMKASSQKKIATGLADAVEGAIKTAKTGVAATGSESSGSKVSSGDDDEEDDTSSRRTGGGKIKDLYFEDDTITLEVGKTKTLTPVYEPENADNIKFTWKTTSSSIVSVDEKGKIKGLKAGTATITATTTDGSSKRASIEIVVGDGATSKFTDTGISLSQAGDVYIYDDWLQLYPGSAERVEILSASNDKVVKNAEFKWKSDDTKVATVDAYGVVTAKSKGSATITATGGGYTLTCDIDVSTDKITAKGISLDKKSLVVIRKQTAQLKVTFNPKGTTDKTVTWTSSNTSIASVDKNGVITGKNTGNCTITAKSKSGGFKATCDVEVVAKAVEVDYIDFAGYDTLEMQKGSSDTLTLDIYPANATNASVTWKSSNSSVVSVDNEGNVTALKKGTATITVTSVADRNVYATCKITVYE